MAKNVVYIPIKFDLPEEYIRAVRARAGIDNVNPRDVVVLALDQFLAKEVAEARQAAEAANLREAAAWREVASDTAALRQDGLALASALRRVVGLTLSATTSLQQAAAALPEAGDADGREPRLARSSSRHVACLV